MSKLELDLPIRIPGGHMMVALTCFGPGDVPQAFITVEPDDATPARTAIRDQVRMLNALRDLKRPKLLRLIVEQDRSLHEVLKPALDLMEASTRKPEGAAA